MLFLFFVHVLSVEILLDVSVFLVDCYMGVRRCLTWVYLYFLRYCCGVVIVSLIFLVVCLYSCCSRGLYSSIILSDVIKGLKCCFYII